MKNEYLTLLWKDTKINEYLVFLWKVKWWMSTSCLYGRINDKWAPRIFNERQLINEYLVFLLKDKW
jgi:hypothetical protein